MSLHPWVKAAGLAILYAATGGLWILLGDRLLIEHTRDPETLTLLQTYKGWGYVALTSAMAFVLTLALLRSQARCIREHMEHTHRLRDIIDHIPAYTSYLDRNGHLVFTSSNIAANLGVPPDSLIGQHIRDVIGPHNFDPYADKLQAAMAGQDMRFERAIALPDGRQHWMMTHYMPDRNEQGEVVGIYVFNLDLTEHLKLERELRWRNEELESIFQALPDLYFRMRADGSILDYRARQTEALYLPPDIFLGQRMQDILPPDLAEQFLANLNTLLSEGKRIQTYEYLMPLKDGAHYFECRLARLPERDEVVAVIRDVDPIKRAESELEYNAHHDALTGLPNRLLLHARLEHAIEKARRTDHPLAVLFLDLDRFKNVNDSLGHPVGDQLLRAIADRLLKRLRAEDTLARLGGDEFVILIEAFGHPDQIAGLARDILKLLEAPFTLDGGRDIYIGASLGISLYPKDGEDTTTLIRNADAALYKAKASGRHTFRFYTETMTEEANHRLEMEMAMRRALEEQAFVLHYQPLVSIADHAIVGVEALVRWRREDGSLIPPDAFIPLAEDTGLIVPLGEWVLREACTQGRVWLDAGLPPMVMAVNLSPGQFQRPNLIPSVRAILEETGFPAARLELEITETALMDTAQGVEDQLHALKRLGVLIAIDDFGTGYSSLAYLKRFPIDKLKIDKRFIDNLPDDPENAAIARTIIDMAAAFHFTVLAEGVETEAQLDFLRAQGCHFFQGYLFSPPSSADTIEPLQRGQTR
ncbi:MAG: EAL domain-containing protein [Pseudomonadota bacterium]